MTDGARSPGHRGGGRSAGRRGMRAPQERTMRDLYDRTRHRDLAAPEEQAEGRGGGRAEGSRRRELVTRMEDKTVRKRLVSNDGIRMKAESGTCNVCCAPCSSCLHRSLAHADANIDCGSSQTCSTRSEIKNNSLTRSEKGAHNRGKNDEEFSAASSNASYSETGGSKLVTRPSIAENSSEVDMPAKRRRLSNEYTKLSIAEYLDDNNSCVTGMPAEGKLLLEKKKVSASASSHHLTVKDCKENIIASHSRLRKQPADESTEKNQSNVMHSSSSFMTKKLLRMHSSASVSKGLSPKRQAHELGEAQENSSHQCREKASLSNNIMEQTLGGASNPCADDGGNNDMLTGCSGSTGNEKKAGLRSKDLESGTSFSKDQIQQHTAIQTNDDAKRNGVNKQDRDQDSSMDMSNNSELNIQKDVTIDCGDSEGLIDVNVCDICGDVGREYLLATCTRCLEGAEHIYCMRVKLDKVPDGEWLCEECQLKDDLDKTSRKYGVQTVNILEGKKQCSENENNVKALQVVAPNLDTPQINCNTPTVDQCDVKNKKLHLASADTQPQQVKVTNPVAERLEVKNKKILSLVSHKKLHAVTSDLEARSHTSGIPTRSSSNKKNQSSEFLLHHKKLRVSTDMESPLSSEGLRSPTVSCKSLVGDASPPNPRLFKVNSPKKRDVFSRENSFKKSNEGSLSSLDNAPMGNAQVVKSSQILSRSYSMGSMVNAKAPVPSPRGRLSKQLSFNSFNNGPKVKQLAEGVASKLRPVKHSPKDTRDQATNSFMKSGSFKSEGLVCKDASSSKQKQSFHVSPDEKSVLKSMKEKNMMERRASFSFKKPNIPSSPRPVSSMKSGERKLDQDILRPGPSILKSRKKPGNTEKESYDLSKTDKREITVHQKPTGFVSGKDIYGVKIPDPLVPSECVKRDSSNDGEEDGNGMPTKLPGVLPTTSGAMLLESDLYDIVPRVSASEDSVYKTVGCKQKPLESTLNSSCKIVEAAQASDDTLPETESPHGLWIKRNRYPADNKLDKPNLKQEAFHDQSTPENPSRDLVTPEQSYIWQGSFEVSIHGIPEIFDGIQAYLSTHASFKVREVGKQLPHKIQLAEVPRHYTWPLQFKEINPTEDNIALFFFAKDAESYERAYIKLLEGMLLGDLSLTANIGGIELLIFPSDKLPERTQRWNGLLFFWGIFYARKASSLPEVPVSGTNNCPLDPITEPVIQHDVCFRKAVQSLVIDLNECPNDDLPDPAVPLGPEMEKTGAPVDHNIWFESKHEDRKLNACEIHHKETAGNRQIVSSHPTASPDGTYFPKIPSGEGRNMVKDYPSAAKETTGIAGNSNMDEEGFCQHETLFCVAPQAGAVKSVLGEMVVKKQALQPSAEVSLRHFIGSNISDEPNKLISKSGIGSSDSDPSSKRQKTSHGKHSACSFEELPSKCLSKIHPLSTGQQNPFDDAQYIYRAPSDLGSLKKSATDHVIYVLSSDDEESPKPSTRLSNKASLKADEGFSPLLSLSLSTVSAKHNLAGSDIGEDEPLSLSLGLPGVVDGSRVFEMKQFLPEKPGINT